LESEVFNDTASLGRSSRQIWPHSKEGLTLSVAGSSDLTLTPLIAIDSGISICAPQFDDECCEVNIAGHTLKMMLKSSQNGRTTLPALEVSDMLANKGTLCL